MAVAIRLKRGGRTHAPYYRMIVVDSRTRRDGRVLDEIGVYQPVARPEPRVEVDVKKALSWLHKGAQPSDTARTILSQKGILAQFSQGVKPEDIADDVTAESASPAAAATAETSTATAGE